MSDRYKLVFGFALLLVIAILAVIIALGKVSQENIYGLDIVLGCIATLSGNFAMWAFGQSKKDGS